MDKNNVRKCKCCKKPMRECVNYFSSDGGVQEIPTGRYVCMNDKCTEFKKPKD